MTFRASLIVGCAAVLVALGASAPAAKPGASLAMRAREVLNRNCARCHSAAPRQSGLDLRTHLGLLRGGRRGPAIVPRNASQSRLYRQIAGLAEPSMPPQKRLSQAEIETLRQWINAGAPDPTIKLGDVDPDWAFQPRQRPATPKLKDAWARRPIDAFILARLRQRGLRPNPPADRVTLIRRVTYDLTGLPPTPDEIDAFITDKSPGAYERLLDRLLASPHYGEKAARQWLDLARYAESEGFKSDENRPNAWRYRDYLIQSFNADKPYDRFVMEQIAGDELWPNDPNALVATAFNRHWADESNARNLPLRHQEILNDITDTVGAVFLGMTVGCARCHDHKYDPITQKDYYSLQAFFAAIRARDDLTLGTPAERQEYARRQQAWEEKTHGIQAEMKQIAGPVRQRLRQSAVSIFPDAVIDSVNTPYEKRTAYQRQLAFKVEPQIRVTEDKLVEALSQADQERYKTLKQQLAAFDGIKPQPLPTSLGITDVGPEAPRTHVLSVGVYDKPLEEVQPAFFSRITTVPPKIAPPAGGNSTGRRTALARWMVDPRNPLVARVIVNRVWQWRFGEGLSPSASNFGRTGGAPSHPKLIDWLAEEFIAGGWSLKSLHKLVMTSNTYRQSTAYDAAKAQADPENHLLWRMRRRRLQAEEIRDGMLLASGLLNPKMGGPSVFGRLPKGVEVRGGWTPTEDPREHRRRSVYLFVKRNVRYPLFLAFDLPDTHESCPRRAVSTTAPQALMLLNDEETFGYARAFAGQVLEESDRLRGVLVGRAYRLAFGRMPDPTERRLAYDFLDRQARLIRAREGAGQSTATPTGTKKTLGAAQDAALVDFCHALLNANEFLYLD